MRAKRNEANEPVEPTETNPEDQSEPTTMSIEEGIGIGIGNATEIQIGRELIARGRSDEL